MAPDKLNPFSVLMPGYEDRLVPRNRALRILLLLLMGAAVLVFYIEGRIHTPTKSAVNGIYFNKCCGEIVLRDGDFSYKNKHYHYDLENMKFGLTAYVQANLTQHGIADSSDPTPLLFSANEKSRSFKTVIGTKEYSFLRIR